MLKITDTAANPLNWAQTSNWTPGFVLTSGDDTAGTLTFASMFGTLATAETGDGCWTFKRVGFWQRRASIRGCGAETDLAAFDNDTWAGGGSLDFAGGSHFRATTNFWRTRLQFEDDNGHSLVSFHYGGMFRLKAEVEVSQAARALAELPLLVTFGWYLAVMLHRDAVSSAVVTTG